MISRALSARVATWVLTFCLAAPAWAQAPAPAPTEPAPSPAPTPMVPAPEPLPPVAEPLPPVPDSVPAADALPELPLIDETEIKLTSRTPLTMRDAPGVVSVLQRDEIVASGARDLLDLLQLVPGFSVGVDVQGVVSVSFRGQWGHEGKVLFLVDGHEMNETLYSTMQLGMHIPTSIMQRLEVIRGPGSAVFGGYAELAVVNVVTRAPGELNGGAANAYYGHMEDGFGRVMISASGGAEVKKVPGLGLKLDLAYLRGVRSDRTYFDDAGGSYAMRDGSAMQTFLLNFALTYKRLSVRFLFDDHFMLTQDGSGLVSPAPVAQRFRGYFLDVRYDHRVGKYVTLLPRFSFKHQTPWQTSDQASDYFYDKSALRLLAGMGVSIDPLKSLNILAGAEGYWDRGQLNTLTVTGYQTLFAGDRTKVDYGNIAAYAQVFWRNRIVNVTAGARYEYNTAYGHSIVPRVGFTRVLGRFNFKLLYSLAFRGPAIENLNINPDITPERTHVVEAEAGVQISGHWALTLNGYWMRITSPIIYTADPVTNAEGYFNADHTGTGGLEAQLRAKYAWLFGSLTYSFYTAAGQNAVDLYRVVGHDSLLLGAPAHKVTLATGINVWRDRVALGLTAIYMSPRYRAYIDAAGNPASVAEPNTFLLGANVTYRNLGLKGLDLTAGAHNILGQEYRAVQPYDGGHAPYPLASREVYLQLAYATR